MQLVVALTNLIWKTFAISIEMMSIHMYTILTEKGRDVADEKQASAFFVSQTLFFYSLQLQYYPIALFSSAIGARGIVSSYSASEINWQLVCAVLGSTEEKTS